MISLPTAVVQSCHFERHRRRGDAAAHVIRGKSVKLRLVQVGLGGWGQDWFRTILTPSDEVELVGFVDADAGTLSAARERLALPPDRCFATLGEALAAVQAEAVLITAALGAHVPVALAALEAGLHVLVEKPFAPTVAEARQVVETAAARQRLLMVSQNYRFYPAVRAVAALLRAQTLGPIDAVQIDFRRYARGNVAMGNRHFSLSHPLLLDMAIHHFDLMRLVIGQEPQLVSCHAWNPPWSQFIDPASAVATISFDGGAVASYRGSWVSPGPETPWAGEWRVACQGGEIVWTSRANQGIGADSVTLRPLGKAPRKLELPALGAIDRAGTLAAFVAAVHSGQEPECSGRDNLGTLALMRAAIEAAETGLPRRVEV
jgi:predicted dehydrogenase